MTCNPLVLVLVLGLAAGDSGTRKPDPPGTGRYLTQFRNLFDKWDADKDGVLDKEELAKAFRGPDAKPSDKDGETGTPEALFLEQLDTDGDDKISRAEWDAWARDLSVALKQRDDARERYQATLGRYRNATSRREKELLSRQLQLQKQDLDNATRQVQKLDQHFRKAKTLR